MNLLVLMTIIITLTTTPPPPQDCPTALIGETTNTLISDRVLRDYLLYVPESATDESPLVIALHGFGSNMTQFSQLTGWYSIADEQGAVIAFPQGFRSRWYANIFDDEDIDDVLFIRDLLADIRTYTCFDAVYVTGFSNGGGMTERIACEMSADIRAIGIVAGAVNADFEMCQPQNPIPLIAFHGVEDSVVPYEGLVTGVLALPDIPTWAESWARRNDCDGDATIQTITDGIQQVAYTDCAANVLLYVVESGQHDWFGAASVRVQTDIHATEMIWAFFMENTLNVK
jgi:polyhydroxybutyrate depolymerase